jgi:predicted amidophosphoribosyltransferase
MLTEATRIPICNECLGSFQQIHGTVCDKCGIPVENAPVENNRVFICPRCTSPDHRSLAFDSVRSWSFYDGAMVQAILFLKFENIDPLGELFASCSRKWPSSAARRLKPTSSSPSPCIAVANVSAATIRPRLSPNRSQNAPSSV